MTSPGALRSMQARGPSTTEVQAAIAGVLDPELDEPLLALGFIGEVRLAGEQVEVELKLPTYWCAANFAYLMAGDLRERLLAVPGVRQARVVVVDHFAAAEIGEGVSAGRSFVEAFPGLADGDLDELRRQFQRKAFGLRQERLVRFLLGVGLSAEQVVALRLGDLEWSSATPELRVRVDGAWRRFRAGAEEARLYLDRRRAVGLDCGPAAPLVVDLDGRLVRAGALTEHLRSLRRQRVSMELNATLCQGLHRARYGWPGAPGGAGAATTALITLEDR